MKRLPMTEVVAKETMEKKIQIVDIENMLTQQDIADLEYGKELEKYYIFGKKYMIKAPNNSFLIKHPNTKKLFPNPTSNVKIADYSGSILIEKDSYMSKDCFNKFIIMLKDIGERFMYLRNRLEIINSDESKIRVKI